MQVTVNLADVEPMAGLLVNLGRFAEALDEEARAALSTDAESAWSDVEVILARLHRARVDTPDEE